MQLIKVKNNSLLSRFLIDFSSKIYIRNLIYFTFNLRFAVVFLYTGGYMKDLKDIKCYLLDMDGTIYLGNKLIDGAKEFLEKIKAKKYKIYIFNK